MPKSHFIVLALAALLLIACQSTGLQEPSDPPQALAPTAAETGAGGPPQMVCTSVTSAEMADQMATAVASSPFPPVSEADWRRGPEDARVTIIEYGDLQCPSCAALEPLLRRIQTDYPDDVQVVFRHFPLIGSEGQPIHSLAALAAQASEAAGRQGAFWEMHDLLYARQPEWTGLDQAAFEAWLLDAAAELGLGAEQFAEDLHDPDVVRLAQEAWEWGFELGLPGTPLLVINGFPYQWQGGYASLEAIVKVELLAERQFEGCPPMVIDPQAEYTATLHTEKGDIVIQLLPDTAPMAVNSFVFLAQNDWFDNVTFHRVIPGFMAQGGDPTGTGIAGPGYTFAIEVSPEWAFDRAGLLAMANSGPAANGSQFFITYGAAEHLNGAYTIFGEVLSGMDVLESLAPRNPAENPEAPPGDLILDVSIEEH